MPRRKSTSQPNSKRTPRTRRPKRARNRRPTSDLDQLMTQWEQRQAAERAEVVRRLQADCDQLAALDVAKVNIPYNGYGDSGTVETPSAADANNQPVSLPGDLVRSLSGLAEALIPSGWENDAGAYGELIIDVAERSCRRAHHWRVETSEYDEEIIPL